MALCPWCWLDVPIRLTRGGKGVSVSFAAHVAKCPSAPEEIKAAYQGCGPDYLTRARRET